MITHAQERYGIIVCPVYRTELDPAALNAYGGALTEADIVCRGLRDVGTIEVGQPVEDEMNRYDLGSVPLDYQPMMRFGIIAIGHILPISREGIVQQGALSPANRPYDEDPISLRAIGVSDTHLFCLAGFLYLSNRYTGRLEIHRKQTDSLPLYG
jgi:hypothetical protein